MSSSATPRRKRVLLWCAATLAFAVGGIAVAWRLLHLSELAVIGTGYAAHQTCSCVFISHRTPESCRGDLERLARWFIPVEVDADAGHVTASAYGAARAVAKYQPGFGCAVED